MKKLYYLSTNHKHIGSIELLELDVIAETEFHWTIPDKTNQKTSTISKLHPFGWVESKAEAIQNQLKGLDKSIRYNQERCEVLINLKRSVEEQSTSMLE